MYLHKAQFNFRHIENCYVCMVHVDTVPHDSVYLLVHFKSSQSQDILI